MSQASDKFELEILPRKAHYLEVLHEFALSQENQNTLDELLLNVAKTAIAKSGSVDIGRNKREWMQ